ncbi:hypothetical protein DNU06_16745 [Putridiphycobacter roseus]|uniref:Uncharacterized protein n=1 Tax=Putridiphycobacter roseus TaxID=2219161 RepID=A0A2W1N9H5_9FLAO|nr:hypothetical protein [Putridiphycobacter roseus]PZE15693.1 hypothetical protein DNU06_16745 [Putridiphycobacter roseus]
MGKTNFHSLQELASSLKDKVEKLASGSLPIDEVEALTESAKEIYERLVIIRYKSYENNNEKVVEKVQKAVAKKVEEKEELVGSEEELMMFDFTESEPIIQEPEVKEAPEIVPDITIDLPIEQAEFHPNHVEENLTEKKEGSLNDHFKKEDDSVGNKLSKSPIPDLKAHIGMNHKFTYIRELFNGNSEDYNVAVENLNQSGSKAAAFSLLENMQKAHSWDLESQTVLNFTELIERRFTN